MILVNNIMSGVKIYINLINYLTSGMLSTEFWRQCLQFGLFVLAKNQRRDKPIVNLQHRNIFKKIKKEKKNSRRSIEENEK